MFETAKPFLLSLALGLLLGIERERSFRGKVHHPPFGSRTFALMALLGTLAAHLNSGGVAIVLAAFAVALVLASYLRPARVQGYDGGTTTEVAAVLAFGLGWLAHGAPRLATMLAVMVFAVLWLKARIHSFAHEGLSDQEVGAAMGFLVIALVVLPLLPDRTVDPWGIVNPSRLWLLFVLIAGVGFAGYIAVRALGPTRGLAAAGFFAGLVSSTAATLSLSRRARREGAVAGPLATGIVLANVASVAAQILIVGVTCVELLPKAALVLAAPIVVGVIGTWIALWWLRHRAVETTEAAFQLANPLEFKPALAMATVFFVILVILGAVQRMFGASGVLTVAALTGLNDVHAATLGAATLARTHTISGEEALLAILAAFTVNMCVKLGITAFAGGRRLFLIAAPPLACMAISAVIAFSILLGH